MIKIETRKGASIYHDITVLHDVHAFVTHNQETPVFCAVDRLGRYKFFAGDFHSLAFYCRENGFSAPVGRRYWIDPCGPVEFAAELMNKASELLTSSHLMNR